MTSRKEVFSCFCYFFFGFILHKTEYRNKQGHLIKRKGIYKMTKIKNIFQQMTKKMGGRKKVIHKNEENVKK